MHGMIVQLTVEGGQCSDIVDTCGKDRCSDLCTVLYGNRGKGSFCDEFRQCTCLFDQAPSSKDVCIIGAGSCSKGKCDLSCCDARCAKEFKGVGTCIKNDGTDDRCVCTYNT